MSQQHPDVHTPPPGPRSRELAKRLDAVECPELHSQKGPAPIVWERASGSNVFDADGNRYVDLLAGFGVAALGYAHPEVTTAIAEQAARLPNSLSDVYPSTTRIELLEALARRLPGDLGQAILSGSGGAAIESALKTALRVTGLPQVIAFEGAYHGLGLGALDVTHAAEFREPFLGRLPGRTSFVPFGDAAAVRDRASRGDVGAILFEPIQGRGGVVVPPAGFVAELREIADASGALLIADEVYTGLGRTGRWLGCDWDGVLPDVVALGKALGAGFPISACIGRPAIMERWGASQGEALHTSTQLGNPMGCAAGLAALAVLERDGLVERADRVGSKWLETLRRELASSDRVVEVRGRGLMLGIELDRPESADRAVEAALARGWILIQEGPIGQVLSLTPPLNIDQTLLDGATDMLVEILVK